VVPVFRKKELDLAEALRTLRKDWGEWFFLFALLCVPCASARENNTPNLLGFERPE